MSAVKKYRREEKVKLDKAQCVFSPNVTGSVGILPNPGRLAIKTDSFCDTAKKVTCPFCLSMETLGKFLVSTKKGISRRLGKCPICGKGVMLKTLMNMIKWGPVEYANFVYGYRTMGFWDKIDRNDWKRHLKIMGWTEEFWNQYKKMRGR